MRKIWKLFAGAALLTAVVTIHVGTAHATAISYLGDLTDGVYHTASNLGFWTLSVNAGDSITVQANRFSAVDLSAGAWDGLESDTTAYTGFDTNSTSTTNVGYGDDEIAPICSSCGGGFGDPLFTFVAAASGIYTVAVSRFYWNFGPADYEVRAMGSSAVVAATPLPGALPLFISAAGLLGLFGWRKKRKVAALAA